MPHSLSLQLLVWRTVEMTRTMTTMPGRITAPPPPPLPGCASAHTAALRLSPVAFRHSLLLLASGLRSLSRAQCQGCLPGMLQQVRE
jgi:hypothetical protein